VNGWPFDGSSIRLFKSIEESDMLLIPDVKSCWIDPFMKHKTLHVTCDVAFPDRSYFDRCPRSICAAAEKYVKELSICDTIIVGPEVEFFLFDHVEWKNDMNHSKFKVETAEGYWRSGEACSSHPSLPAAGNGNDGQRMGRKQYYAPTIPIDRDHGIRNDMLLVMDQIGIPTEKHHHEVACGQQELGVSCSTMLETADNVIAYKYVVKNVAKLHNKSATFMPKPIAGDNGSGMHMHFSLWNSSSNLFYDKAGEYHQLSQKALYFIGGILKHAPALLAICCPTVNSYKRLTPGFEAPSILSFSAGNRSACVRIPMVGRDQWRAKRMEFRCPDPTANPYLCIAACIMAGIDGILNKIEPPKPLDTAVETQLSLTELESMATRATPNTLLDALDALESDRAFLMKGNVFTKNFLDAYTLWKRNEYRQITNVPTPKEYEYYYAM